MILLTNMSESINSMTPSNWMGVFSKTKILVITCCLALVINFLVFNRSSSPFDRTWRISDQSEEKVSDLGIRDISFYITEQELRKEHSGREIWSNIHNVLMTLNKMNPASLTVLKDIILKLRDSQDVTRLLSTLENINSPWLKNGAVNLTKFRNTDKQRCTDPPSDLFGNIASNLATVVPKWLENNYEKLEGGHYEPEDCAAVEKLAIIIPYRNRHSHLHILLNNLLPVLIRQKRDFRIFVIEQAPPTTFNRGMLFNIGYLEALKIDNFDCFIFHDVDMILVNDKCIYKCAKNPRHMPAAISKWKYGLPYKLYFGGVVAFTREQFRIINGCSNLYFGWGGEDDDLRARMYKFGYKMIRYPVDIGRYDTIPHAPDRGNSPNPDRMKLVNSSPGRQNAEGLNTTKFIVTGTEFKRLYTWIQVRINMTEVLQTTPKEMLNDVSNLIKQSRQFDHFK
uniref:Beta-1,4-galactosyltransferase n=1 Tax=Arion vulgaris TaxID=1028688 RepID=A0A0B7B2K3_9EUPU